jgi:hypothetical protein
MGRTLQQPVAGNLDGLDRDGENMGDGVPVRLRPSAHSRPRCTSSAACSISLCLCTAVPLDCLGLMLRVGVTQTNALMTLYS